MRLAWFVGCRPARAAGAQVRVPRTQWTDPLAVGARNSVGAVQGRYRTRPRSTLEEYRMNQTTRRGLSRARRSSQCDLGQEKSSRAPGKAFKAAQPERYHRVTVARSRRGSQPLLRLPLPHTRERCPHGRAISARVRHRTERQEASERTSREAFPLRLQRARDSEGSAGESERVPRLSALGRS